MINFEEVLKILEANGLNRASIGEEVARAVEQIILNPDDRPQVISFLKLNGWMAGAVGAGRFDQAETGAAPGSIAGDGVADAVDTMVNKNGIRAVRRRRGSVIRKIAVLLLLFIVVLAGGGLLYVFVQKIGPFALPMYTEKNFLSGIAQKIDQINSAAYSISGELGVVDRDKDAQPFAIKEMSNAALLKRQYENDSQRLEDVGEIISELNHGAGYSYYSSTKNKDLKSYPANINNLFGGDTKTEYSRTYSIKDPKTGRMYTYRIMDGGKNFALTVNFETEEAIKRINMYENKGDEDKDGAAPTTIAGRTVTFSKDSDNYIYMSSEPPKPFFELLSDYLRMVPPELKIRAVVGATTEVKQDMMADWKFNAEAEGDFGDLSYKANVDALRKDDTYYFRLNNFPSLFLFGDLALIKGKWVSFNPNTDTFDNDNDYSSLAELGKNAAKMEKDFKENRKKFVKLIKKEIELANQKKLIVFKKKPIIEKINDRQLIRYELSFKKEAILPFYLQLQEDIKNDPALSSYKFPVDQGLIDYLKSDQFDEVFNYFTQNNTLVLWTDANGYPAIFQETLRIVPPDTATQLEGKQIYLTFKTEISAINAKVDIAAPKESTPIRSVIEKFNKNIESSDARKKARDARRLSDMRQLVSAQEMYYGENDVYAINKTKAMPTSIGTYITAVPKDPVNSDGAACGSLGTSIGNYRYCALANAADWFCYYTKLENPKTIGGATFYFYTSSEKGNFYRKTEPATRATCNQQG